MVDSEFDQIWAQYERAKQSGETDPEDEGKSEDDLKDEYRQIAHRRVQLGMLLSEVGRQNEISVGQDEVNRAIVTESAKVIRGRSSRSWSSIRTTRKRNASLRAPLMEDKVIDFILEMAQVEDRDVSVEDLMKDPDEAEADAKPAKKSRGQEGVRQESRRQEGGREKGCGEKGRQGWRQGGIIVLYFLAGGEFSPARPYVREYPSGRAPSGPRLANPASP